MDPGTSQNLLLTWSQFHGVQHRDLSSAFALEETPAKWQLSPAPGDLGAEPGRAVGRQAEHLTRKCLCSALGL